VALSLLDPLTRKKAGSATRGDGNPRNQEEREAKEGIKLFFKFSKIFFDFQGCGITWYPPE